MDDTTVVVFDTTLRDGEQAPGFSMRIDEKLKMARQLASMGVDIIEAGFPIASEADAEAVRTISTHIKGPVIAALARCNRADIERAAWALEPAARKRIHVFIATSDLHLERKLRMSRSHCLKVAMDAVRHARTFTDDVQFSAEDATRSDPDFLWHVIEAVIQSGAKTINLPDTVGYSTPDEIQSFFSRLINRVPSSDQVVWSTHCHDDLGLAVANTLAALTGGARQVECTINGIGERAGNASLEEVVMATRVRSDRLPFDSGIDTKQIYAASQLLTSLTGEAVQANKAIVGRNAFAHEAGIHQDGMLKHTQTYEIMTPESVGGGKTSLVMGKHSGRHAFIAKLEELGYKLSQNALEDAFYRFKALADRKKLVYDEDIEALVDEGIATASDRIKVVALTVIAGTMGPQSATLTLDVDGTHKTVQATGNGPIDATFNAIKQLVPHETKLQLYQVHAVTEGTDAQAEVSVRLEDEALGKAATGRAADPDTLVASAKAYLGALNKLEVKRLRNRPAPLEDLKPAERHGP